MNWNKVKWGLEELSCLDYQERVWCKQEVEPTEISSFEEAVSLLFDDSGLADYLYKNTKPSNLRDVTFKKFQAFEKELKRVPVGLKPNELISMPTMRIIRNLAEELLHEIKMSNLEC